jgi:parvulin-like peptidyl-prolyl isomerase
VQRYSVCPSARQGGELGWLGRGEYFPAFEAAVFEAGVGEVVRATTPRGHHLIHILEEK